MCNDINCQYAVWGKQLQTRLKNINRILSLRPRTEQPDILTNSLSDITFKVTYQLFNYERERTSAIEETQTQDIPEPVSGLDLGHE